MPIKDVINNLRTMGPVKTMGRPGIVVTDPRDPKCNRPNVVDKDEDYFS
jgi:hypothetical protein